MTESKLSGYIHQNMLIESTSNWSLILIVKFLISIKNYHTLVDPPYCVQFWIEYYLCDMCPGVELKPKRDINNY